MIEVRKARWSVPRSVIYIQRISIDELHHYSMSVIVHRFGNRKASIIKSLGRVRR